MTAAVAPSPLTPAAPLPKTAWIVSRGYDLAFFSGSVVVPLLLWCAFSRGILSGIAVYVVFQLLFNMPHNVQTWTMSVLDEADRRKNGSRYLVALVVIVALFGGAMTGSPQGVYPWLRDALVYWGYYHLVRQHYGFQRLYERRMAVLGSPPSPRESALYARFLDVVSYAPLLLRFRDPELMTIRAAGRAVHVRHPILPPVGFDLVLGLYLACIGVAVVHHAVATARGRRHMHARALLLASVTAAFGIAGLAIDDIIVSIAVVTSFHNLQYLGLTLLHNRTRAAIADRERLPFGHNRPIDWLRAGRLAPYLVMTFGYGLCVFAPRIGLRDVPLAELPITVVVAMHYYVDSRIWRFRDYPNLARYLRLAP